MFSKTYTIPLEPIVWKRAGTNFQRRTFYDRQKQDKVAIGLYLLNQHDKSPQFQGPLKWEMDVYFAIPQKNKTMKEDDWYWKVVDFDNLKKFMFDTITDTKIWVDDAQVCWIGDSKKRYSHNPRTIITITQLLD